ncbi:uncharacterized protein LOC115694091 [Syzygium oleosum]|uniref:uncharacterized protein LOC115694091 n=1 Tax=Syzygium oleosum TaxID=219896 RepID=UPI0024BB34DA|nr:uncharacterized protein LOC115694091 [Syzygium oleosum]
MEYAIIHIHFSPCRLFNQTQLYIVSLPPASQNQTVKRCHSSLNQYTKKGTSHHLRTKNTETMSLPKHLHVHLYPILIFTILLIFSTPPSHSSSAANDNSLSAYEVLEEYDFPIGLLPNGVLGYELDNSTGEFTAYLNGSCTFSIDSYELKYSSSITGIISTDKLSSLSGIKVKVWFFWLSIVKVVRDSDELEFSVGIASADFAVSNFDECPTCGCGFDCDSVEKKRKFRIKNPFWASS